MSKAVHTGLTEAGNIRDVRVERIRNVTIYRRGSTYYVYFREGKKSVRQRVDGNLSVARAMASKVASSLDEGRPSPIGFQKIPFADFIQGFLEYTGEVQRLATRTQERYAAALNLLKSFASQGGIERPDMIEPSSVEDFVKWLRRQKRSRNGSETGKQDGYKTGGIRFVLGVARTAFNWAMRRRHMPPFVENPLKTFPIDKLRDRDEDASAARLMSREEQDAFFAACDEWQRRIFLVLASYGMRVGEFAHLLIEDVDLKAGTVSIQSKPDLFWHVKTGRHRVLPIFEEARPLFERAIGGRRGGFLFLNDEFVMDPKLLPVSFASGKAFRERIRQVAEAARKSADGNERAVERAVNEECRRLGQIPEKRIRQEYMGLTKRIGRPDLTRAHDLRHLCASRAQEMGLNPILVAELLGHRTLEMTRRYTHLGLDAKREALRKAAGGLISKAGAEGVG